MPHQAMTGWFAAHKDTSAPAAIDFMIGAPRADLLVLTCPACEAQLELVGDAQPHGRVITLIGDHIRTHAPSPWR